MLMLSICIEFKVLKIVNRVMNKTLQVMKAWESSDVRRRIYLSNFIHKTIILLVSIFFLTVFFYYERRKKERKKRKENTPYLLLTKAPFILLKRSWFAVKLADTNDFIRLVYLRPRRIQPIVVINAPIAFVKFSKHLRHNLSAFHCCHGILIILSGEKLLIMLGINAE